MLRNISIFLAAAALVSACSLGDRTVERSVEDVRAMLQANDEALSLTHYLPSANHTTEHVSDGLIWHFTLNNQEYARMVVSVRPKDAQSTSVSSRFEEVDDAVGHGVAFLRRTAEMTSEEILTATLEGRPVNHGLLRDQFNTLAAKDSQLVAQAYTESTAKLFQEVQETGGAFSVNSDKPTRSSKPYDQKQPYDRTPAYDRN
jgi:hypothetical protein